MYFITTKRMLEVCFSAHPNIQYRTFLYNGVHLSIHMHPLQRTGMSRQARVSCS